VLVSPNPISLAVVAGSLAALKMARQWEQAVVLRAGQFLAVRRPGLFWIVPVLDSIAALIDARLRTTQFVAEQTLAKDTVPVDVDAIIFWIVTDVRRAALEVANYAEAIARAGPDVAAQRIGASDLAMLLSDRGAADEELRKTIDAKTESRGIRVQSVEIRDVGIPVALQDAMSR
jgi:regulator of protease activity HflC (stomatin/prohibitin superfamily)